MSLSKSKSKYSNNCLHFWKRIVPFRSQRSFIEYLALESLFTIANFCKLGQRLPKWTPLSNIKVGYWPYLQVFGQTGTNVLAYFAQPLVTKKKSITLTPDQVSHSQHFIFFVFYTWPCKLECFITLGWIELSQTSNLAYWAHM